MLSKKQHVDDTRVIFHARDFLSDFCAARAPLGWRARMFSPHAQYFPFWAARAPFGVARALFFRRAPSIFHFWGARAARAKIFFNVDIQTCVNINRYFPSLKKFEFEIQNYFKYILKISDIQLCFNVNRYFYSLKSSNTKYKIV